MMGRFISADDSDILDGGNDHSLENNLFAYCFNNPVSLTDGEGNWPFWAKALTVAAIATVAVAATVMTLATFGAGSVAGVAMITGALTFAARTTEVASLQVKKSKSKGKSNKQTAVDSIESMHDNGLRIMGITPLTKGISIGSKQVLNYAIKQTFGGTAYFRDTLSATGGKLLPYGFAAYAWSHTIRSLFSNDPEKRAQERGYKLK